MIYFNHVRGATFKLTFNMVDPQRGSAPVDLAATTITAELRRTDTTLVQVLDVVVTDFETATIEVTASIADQENWPVGRLHGRVDFDTALGTDAPNAPALARMKSQVFAVHVEHEL